MTKAPTARAPTEGDELAAALRPARKADSSRFMTAEHARQILFYHAMLSDTMEDIANPAFWQHLQAQLKPLDRVEVILGEGTHFLEFLVLRSGADGVELRPLRGYELNGAQFQVRP